MNFQQSAAGFYTWAFTFSSELYSAVIFTADLSLSKRRLRQWGGSSLDEMWCTQGRTTWGNRFSNNKMEWTENRGEEEPFPCFDKTRRRHGERENCAECFRWNAISCVYLRGTAAWDFAFTVHRHCHHRYMRF